MNLRIESKDEITQQLRQLIGKHVLLAQETDRAAANTCTIMFQSITYPERHLQFAVRSSQFAIKTKLGGLVPITVWVPPTCGMVFASTLRGN